MIVASISPASSFDGGLAAGLAFGAFHGWQSVPGGVKPTYLQDHGHEVINPALPDDDFPEAVRIAQTEFDKHQPRRTEDREMTTSLI